MRKEFFSVSSFTTLAQAQQALDAWVIGYNTEREHQGIGDIVPVRRFELAATTPATEIDDGNIDAPDEPARKTVNRRVDEKGRISILKHRYHVGMTFTGQTVTVEAVDGLLHVSHNQIVVATHARRHLAEEDEHLDRRKTIRPSTPTRGSEVFRRVDSCGVVNFAGTSYRAGNRYRGQLAGVRIVGDTVQITIDGTLIRTHRSRHDPNKEYGALGYPNGKPRRTNGVA